MELVDVCIYMFVKSSMWQLNTILILCNFPLENPTSPRGVFIWFALDGAFNVQFQVLLKSLLVKVVNHLFISQKLSYIVFSFSSVIKYVPAHYVCSFHKLTILGNWTRKIKILFKSSSSMFFHSHMYFSICIFIVYFIN